MLFSFLAAILLGMSKAGVKGPGIVIVGLIALDFGAKASTGLLLPLLLFADFFAVYYYRRHTEVSYLKKLLPMMVVGVLLATYVGEQISEAAFKYWMAWLVIVGFVLMLIRDFYWKDMVPNHFLYGPIMGLLSGFTSMIGNLAGPFANLYFLSFRVEKIKFISTAAWMFLFVNLFKLPFHFFVWHTINRETLLMDSKLLIFVVAGFLLGIYLVKLMSEGIYKFIIYLSTVLGAALILMS